MERVKQRIPKTKNKPSYSLILRITFFLIGISLGVIILVLGGVFYFEQKYKNLVYPGIKIGGIESGGKSREEIEKYFAQKSFPFSKISITFNYEDTIATLSGKELNIAYDGKLSADQAYSLGRSGHVIGDTYQKLSALRTGLYLPVVLRLNNQTLNDFLNNLSDRIDIDPQDALFNFENGKVTAFRLSKSGRKVDTVKATQLLNEYLRSLSNLGQIESYHLSLPIPVEVLAPSISTEGSNNLGIKELIGRGQSTFFHSIAGRIHNIFLAASHINGHLIPPGKIFSFNDAVGDISAATGFQPAYIIKDGKTVLGDGGGVCQVSTTLFRAALNSGLSIVERHAHDYRVGYYEQDSKPGFDATVYAPSYDLKIKNDTDNYILIQAQTDINNLSLAFELYGTRDGRAVDLTTPRVYSQSPPPPDLYQDDPTLPAGTVKQTDFAASGAKVDFNYKVKRGDQILSEQTFFSNYRPWQAVYLRGTKT